MSFLNRATELSRRGALVSVILAPTLLFGCGGDPYAGRYAKTRPEPEPFVGNWLLKKNPAGGIPPGNASKLTFGADGSFKAMQYPGEALGEFSRGESFVDGEGTWAIKQHQDFWVIRIHWEVIDAADQGYGEMLHILHDRPPYVLHHIIGDPDSGQALLFEGASK